MINLTSFTDGSTVLPQATGGAGQGARVPGGTPAIVLLYGGLIIISRTIRFMRTAASALIVAGGILVCGTAFYIAQQMTDVAALTVGLPNFVAGMLCIGVYIVLSRRIAQLRQIAITLSRFLRMAMRAVA